MNRAAAFFAFLLPACVSNVQPSPPLPRSTPPTPRANSAAVELSAPFEADSVEYAVCSDAGWTSVSAGDQSYVVHSVRAVGVSGAERVRAGEMAWRVGEPAIPGMMHVLTAVALDARPPLAVAVPVAQRETLLAILDSLGPAGAGPVRASSLAHRIGAFTVHLPAEAAFSHVHFRNSRTRTAMAASFAARSLWSFEQMRERTPTIVGIAVRYGDYRQPISDSEGELVGTWHAEADVAGQLLMMDASGDEISEEEFIRFMEDVLRAAQLHGALPCRVPAG